jgi:hypothetical protein
LESFVKDSGLESLVENFIQGQTQNVIEFELLIGQKSVSVHSSEEGSTFEQSSWVFLLQSEEFSGSLSELGKSEMNSPNFSFILKTVLTDQLKFVIDSFLFERSSWCLISTGV